MCALQGLLIALVDAAFTDQISHAVFWIGSDVICIHLADEADNVGAALFRVIAKYAFLHVETGEPFELAIDFSIFLLGKHFHEHAAAEMAIALGCKQALLDFCVLKSQKIG